MNRKQTPLVIALALALGVAAGCAQDTPPAADAGAEAAAAAVTADADAHAAPAQDADHGHAGVEALAVDFPVPENHEPWAPDAPLVEGMARVRTAITISSSAVLPARSPSPFMVHSICNAPPITPAMATAFSGSAITSMEESRFLT